MARRKAKLGDIVHITWVDSVASARWHALDGPPLEPATCYSIGWLIWDENDFTTVAGSMGSDECPEAADFMTIPKAVIQKVVVLDVP